MKIGINRTLVLTLLWVVNFILQSVSQKVHLTLIDNKCFTNTSSAVAALYDLSDKHWKKSELIETEVQYVSANSKKLCEKLDCYDSGLRWKTQSSFELGDINNLVMDRRWEDFPIHLTASSDFKKPQEHRAGIINYDDFVIPFSLHSKYYAHVYICDSSICHWYCLQCFRNTNTTTILCNNKEDKHTIYHNMCVTRKGSTKDKKVINFFNEEKWSHFRMVKRKKELQFIDETGRVLFKEVFEIKNKKLKDVFLFSSEVNGMWKIHDFTYYYSKTTGSTFFKFKVVPGQQCLSMFIAMCKWCSMTVTFFYSDGAKLSVLDYKYFNNTIDTWQEVSVCIDIPKEDLSLEVATQIGNDENIKAFWALSDIRTGQKDDFRYIAPDPTAAWSGKCQSLKSGLVLDKNAPNIDTLENWKVCKDDEMGEDCVPCNQIIPEGCPEQTKYCQLINDSSGNIRSKCYCSIGYQGANCQESCSGNNYGHSCQGSCENCRDGCNKDNQFGKCNTPGYCARDYFGEKCDKQQGMFVFARKPEIEPGITECDLTQASFAGKGRNVKYYKFQYKEVGEDEWTDIVTEHPLEFAYIETVTLKGLKPSTTYQVRVFGFDEQQDLNELSLLNELIKAYEFTTKTPYRTTPTTPRTTTTEARKGRPIVKEDLKVTCVDCSVAVAIKPGNSEYPWKEISLTINGTKMKFDNDVYTMEELTASTLYEICVTGQYGESFCRLFRTQDNDHHIIEEC